MSNDSPHPSLSIEDTRTVERAHAVLQEARRRVALENRLATINGLDESTPHWTLANETAQALEGDILRPELRRVLVERAEDMGVRSFDANLVFALVQDRARRGEPLDSMAQPLSLLAKPRPRPTIDLVPLLSLATATGLAVGTVIAVARWLAA